MALISKDWDILMKLGRELGEAPSKTALTDVGILLACSTSRREYEEMMNAVLEGVRNTAGTQDRVDLVMRAVQTRAVLAEMDQE